MPIDYTHQHLVSAILPTGDSHVPIDPTGGGSLTVDNTVDPPFEASTIKAAGATESAPGEATLATSQQVTLLGPETFDFDTPNFMAPASDWGPAAFTIPAGSWFQVWGIVTEDFQPVTGDIIVIGFTSDPSDFPHFIQLVQYFPAGANTDPPGAATESNRIEVAGTASALDTSLPRWAYTPDEREVVASYQPASAPAEAGSIDIYALVLTPA